MQPQDCIKLLYQSEMGGGHLINQQAIFAENLQKEIAEAASHGTDAPVEIERIGKDVYRLYLSSLQSTSLNVTTLTCLCTLSAQQHQGSLATLTEKLNELCLMQQQGLLPYPKDSVRTQVDAYLSSGAPPISHSERYRQCYRPHYRLLSMQAALFLPVFAAIDKGMASKANIMVAIEGMASAGKSTLADMLQAVYGCAVIHADDFFLQPPMRTPQRLQQPGGNIDYERMAPVLKTASTGQGVRYYPYNCQTASMGEEVSLPPSNIVVVEGVYSMHPSFNIKYDVGVFLHLDATQQTQRILQRSGPQLAARFAEEWIPMENSYFTHFDVQSACDVVVDTTVLTNHPSSN